MQQLNRLENRGGTVRYWLKGVSMLASVLVIGASFAARAADDSSSPATDARVTFSKDIAPIFYSKCAGCHHAGESAPMSLTSYEEARPWLKSIKKNVASRAMPPWHSDPGFGPFKNDRSLSEKEIASIEKWIDTGAPEGDKSAAPAAPKFDDEGWKLGKPDQIIEFEKVDIAADGPDQFRNLMVKLDFPGDKWLRAVEIKPSNRKIVHHMILWQVGEDGQPTPQGWMGAWAAGADPNVFAPGTGRMIKKGNKLMGDMHYHPYGTAGSDVTRIGLYFAEEKDIQKELVNLWVMNDSFEIPAGDSNYEAKSTFKFSQDGKILGLAPHMHYRGKDFVYTATFPDGRKQELLKVSHYDFNWQTNYQFKEPLEVPAGTRIDCVAHWDNSKQNAANPDPNKTVRFGLQSYDEMMIGFVDYIVNEGVRPKPSDDLMESKLEELVAKYPGEVFKVMVPRGPGGSMQASALHVPKTGEGGWYVKIGNLVGKARIFDIKWEGNSFDCKSFIPGQGEGAMKGTLNPANGELDFEMKDTKGNSFPVKGTLVKKAVVSL